jgi:gliding-associated putative ABC transporter substrate-binding component GldG
MATGETSKKLRVGSNAIIFAALAVGVLILANFLSIMLPRGRMDLTGDKIYTLSDASKQLVRSLPERIAVTAYITDAKDLPAPARHLERVGRYVRELLDEYAKASGGKLTWEVVDPGSAKDEKKRKDLEEEAQRAKVVKLTLRSLSKEKLQLQSAYLGISLRYGEAVEAIPQVMSDEGLEYQVSSLIKKLAFKKKKVAFTKGHGEPDFQHGIGVLKEALSRDYEVTQFDLNGTSAVPDDIDALIVYGPKQKFDERSQWVLDQYLMKGRPAALFIDGMIMEQPRGQMPPGMTMPKMAQKNDVGLAETLAAYGFKIGEDLVFDRQNYYGPVMYQGRMALANFPTFPLVGPKELPDPEALTFMRHQGLMVFPFASSVEIVGKPEGKLTPIAHSTAASWKQTGFFMLDPQNPPKPTADVGPFNFGYAFQGKLKSAFANKPAPEGAPGAAPAASPLASGADAPGGPLKESQKQIRLLIVGDSDLASDDYARIFLQAPQFVPGYGKNISFIINTVDWMAEDETLVPLRSKQVTTRLITSKKEWAPLVARLVNNVFLPLGFIAYGVVRWRMRKNRRSKSANTLEG